jgi:hypothetical protein
MDRREQVTSVVVRAIHVGPDYNLFVPPKCRSQHLGGGRGLIQSSEKPIVVSGG